MKKQIDIAWAAGIIEGEGTFSIGKDRTKSVIVRMTDKDVVLRLRSIFGGNFTGPHVYLSAPGRKPLYRWSVSRREEVVELLRAILPHMGERRTKRIKELLEFDEKFPRGYRTNAAQHGTISMYSNKKRCRCGECVDAWRQYQREYRKKTYEIVR